MERFQWTERKVKPTNVQIPTVAEMYRLKNDYKTLHGIQVYLWSFSILFQICEKI